MSCAHVVRYFLIAILMAMATLAGAQVRTISTIAGGNFHGDGRPALEATLVTPEGIARDAAGSLYVVDSGHQAIRKVDAATGRVSTIAGTGFAGFSGDGGPATLARLQHPTFVALAANGDVYISDTSNHRVRVISANTGIITTFAGTGTAGAGASGVAATSAALDGPRGIAITASGDVLIADTGNSRIRKVTAGIVTTLSFSGPLDAPAGLKMDGDDLLVADGGANLVMRRTPAGAVAIIAGTSNPTFPEGDGPALARRLLVPYDVAVGPGGDIFIAESQAHQVRKLSAGVLSTLALPAGVNLGLAFSGGQLLVSDSSGDVVMGVNPANGANSIVVGGGDFTGDGGPATAARLRSPVHVVEDAAGNVFIADDAARRVRRVDAATGLISTYAGTGATGFSGDGGPATAAVLRPLALAFSPSGELHILDEAGPRVRKVAANGVITTVAGGGANTGDGIAATDIDLPVIADIGFDANGNLYVMSLTGLVRKVDAATQLIARVAGSASFGNSPDGTTALSAQFNQPRGFAVSSGGDLFIGDTGNDRVRTVVGGVLGTATIFPAATFQTIEGISSGAGGALGASDSQAHKAHLAIGGALFSFGDGTAGFAGDDGAANDAVLRAPQHAFVRANGGLLIADTGNARIRAVSGLLAQSINFAALASRPVNSPPFTLSAGGGGSELPVIFASRTPATCTTSGVNGTTVTLTGTVGNCTIAANQAGNAEFAAAPEVVRSFAVTAVFTVTPSQTTPNGTISPSTPQAALDGAQVDFTVTPDTDYGRLVSGTCGGQFLADATTFRTNPVHSNCTVIAFFSIKTFIVTTSSTGNGNITPGNGIQGIAIHGQVTYAVTPNPGHAVTMGGTCGGTLTGNSYTTNAIEADCTVTATFTPVPFTVTPSAGPGGNISPNTPQTVLQGLTRNFTITPGPAFLIDTVGGTCGGTLNGNVFTTAPVTASCTVAATFKDRVTIFTVTNTAASGAGTFGAVLQTLKDTCPGGLKRVEFNIPAASDPGCNPATGICVVATPANLVGVRCDNTTVDGYSQPGAVPNTRTDRGNNAQLKIELAGSLTTRQTLALVGNDQGTFNAPPIRNVSVHGIAFPRTTVGGFGGNTGSILGGGGGFVISGNWFGFHADGTLATTGPAGAAVFLAGGRIDGNRVGGPDPADRNLIGSRSVAFCCEASFGPAISANGVTSSVFEGNFINVDPAGERIANNGGFAGGIGLNSPNTVSSTNNIVRRNVVLIPEGSVIPNTGEGNTFTENVLVNKDNVKAIELGGIGNRNQAAPVFGTVTYGASAVNATGTLQSAPSETFRIELFSNAQARPQRLAGGEEFLGAVDVATGANGLASWSIVLPASARNMTATATRLSTGDTSEFTLQEVSQLTVTASSTGNGTITPSGTQTLLPGGQATFALQPAPGHVFTMGGTCGGSVAGNSYTINPVLASCTVTATFTPVLFTVTPSAGAGGTISPSTPQSVVQGQAQAFTVTPGAAFEIDNIGGTCGGTLAGNTYTTAPVVADCTVSATFKDRVTTYTVTTTAVSGPGSLAGTLATMNASCGARNHIHFNIPAATDPGCNPATGICVVATPSVLRIQCFDTDLDGYTQPGASPNTRTDLGNDAQLRIELVSPNDGNPGQLEMRGQGWPFGFLEVRRISVRGLALPNHLIGGYGSNSGSSFGPGGDYTIAGNWFGFHADGSPISTGAAPGVRLFGVALTNNVIGGSLPADRNRFTHRPVGGAEAIVATGVNNSLFEGNFVNVDADGNSMGTRGMNSAIVAGESSGNVLRRNVVLSVGTTAISMSGVGNTLTENVLVTSAAFVRPISLGGSNNGQAFPVFGNVTYGAGAVNASGTLQSAANEAFRIELFSNSTARPGGFAGAERFVGAVTVNSDASGLATWNIALPADARNMTATATRLSTHDTSEFSMQHVSPNLFTVTPSAGPNGAITPSTPQFAAQGATLPFTLAPSAGFEVDAVGGTCGGSLAGLVFTTSAVTVDCTVQATFKATAGPALPLPPDFDGNGTSDLLWQNTDGRQAIWLMNGAGITASQEIIGAGTGWAVMHLADFDGNGKSDLLWQHTDGRMAIYLMNGMVPTVTQQLLNAASGFTVTHTPDLNGDGKQDLVFRHSDGSVHAWLMNGTTITASSGIFPAGTNWRVNRTADFDGDGKDDLLFANTDGRVTLRLMNGLASGVQANLLPAGTGWSATHTPDLDGDGKADIVWHNADGSTAAWVMNGTTMTSGATLLGPGTGWSVTRVGDFNGDGKADLLWENTDGRVAIWLMNGITAVVQTQILNAGGGWTVKRVQDLDGDGKADIVWENVDGRTAVWLMNGTAMASGSEILGGGLGWSVSGVSQ